MNLNRNSLEDFESQVTRNEPALSQWMSNENWHWLRFPYLNEGDTPEKQAGIRTFLAQHGYKIAGITMDFHDYSWNGPYARCKAKGDTQAIESLESSYLAAADNSITYYRSLSQTLYHRDIPYVLLMHVGALDAEMLPRLLELYRSRGFTFISLAEAESDEFYRNDLDLSLSPNPDDLEQAMKARHLTPSFDLIPPDELSTTICQ
jgi:peptidoglycan/xylan/chitin deacetylase (PgdA/CDA1 family)